MFENLWQAVSDTSSFMPHGHCYLWRPEILWLHTGSDLIIGLAYLSIPISLFYFVRRRRDLVFSWIFVSFALFIMACGLTHLFAIYTTWVPSYASEGLLKAGTAAISAATAIALWPLMPKALSIVSPKQYKEQNSRLKELNETLEQRVREKTKDIAQLAAVVESSIDAIVTVDINGHITSWNAAAQKLYGYSHEETLGCEFSLLVPSKLQSEFESIMDNIASGRHIDAFDTVRTTKSGQLVDVSLTISPVRDYEGNLIGAAAISRDISARIQTQKILTESEHKLRKIIDAVPTGVIMVDENGKIVLTNDETENMFGYSHQELLGMKIESLVPPELRQNHVKYRSTFTRKPQKRQMGAGRDLYAIDKNGNRVPVEIGLNPANIEGNVHTIASIVDISKRKQIEAQIRHINEELRAKNSEMEQFVYTVSHDLKSPLVTSQAFIGFLKEDIEQHNFEDAVDSVHRLEKANARMKDLIDDLLELSRVGRMELDLSRLDLNSLIQNVLAEMKERFEAHHMAVKFKKPLPEIIGDQNRLVQVFENLFTNALKYAAQVSRPQITIDWRRKNGEIQICVKDNGPGIEPQYQEKIFGLFQRLETKEEGTGVGLTIVRRIMETHKGRIWVESTPGKGATFWLSFPDTVEEVEWENRHQVSI